MVLSFKVGTFQSIAGTGNQSITGVGFTPKALIIWTHELNSLNSFSSDAAFDIGIASSTSSEHYQGMYNFDASGSADCTETKSDTNLIYFDFNIDNVADTKADLITLGSDGFTLNWTQNTAGSTRFNYIAIGGADLTNVDSGSFNPPASTGNTATTGVGFMPDLVLFITNNMTSAQSNSVVSDTGSIALGCMNSAGEQAAVAVIAEDAVATMETSRYQRDDKCLAIFTKNNDATLSHEATFVSMDNDGFTINYTTAATTSKIIKYLAFKGLDSKIESFTSPTAGTAPVSQEITGTGFEPRGLIFLSVGNTASASIAAHLRLCMGAASLSNEEADVWLGDQDAAADSVTACRLDNASCIRVSDEASSAGSTTTQALADFTSLDSDGFTLNWSVKDGSNAYQVIYIAFGDHTVDTADTRKSNSTTFLPLDSLSATTSKKRYNSTSMF